MVSLPIRFEDPRPVAVAAFGHACADRRPFRASLGGGRCSNIEIKAERVELDHNAGTMTYFGNVRANQGSMRITANRMRADYEDRTIKRITACGNPARYQQLLEADKGLLRANAQTIVYHTHEEQVDLEGEAHLRQGGNEIVGGFIHYDIVAGRINAESGEDGPVTVTVQPPRQNRKP